MNQITGLTGYGTPCEELLKSTEKAPWQVDPPTNCRRNRELPRGDAEAASLEWLQRTFTGSQFRIAFRQLNGAHSTTHSRRGTTKQGLCASQDFALQPFFSRAMIIFMTLPLEFLQETVSRQFCIPWRKQAGFCFGLTNDPSRHKCLAWKFRKLACHHDSELLRGLLEVRVSYSTPKVI